MIAHGLLKDWIPDDLEGPELQRMMGRDWPRYRAMRHRPVRERFAASRLLLKHVAAKAIHAPPHTVELAYQAGGRPFLRGCDQIGISLTHTEQLLMVGITRRGWIGVDAELADRPMLVSGIERQVCTPYERMALACVDEEHRNKEMVRLWTLKEAYSKAIGQGMRFRFNEFGFGPSGRPVQVLMPDGSPGTGREWSFGTCQVEGRYTTSWALFDAGFGDTQDTAAETMLDEGLVSALTSEPEEPGQPAPAEGRAA
ncbi:4'-phosphopantetheinyl transferase superfamily protein [Streptomyces sp. RB6PN25]|uniref:4'-phosphopantetheinyl transferase superfamily protein n=1 Tax=Streptomyces humicola TaxID=2953240 RepID=A0ABT1Q2X1_9ACTN|nr:4'-phosphopantetheinyl transferase superfamily protein [Streptomyces humicola]MCQ4084283.1 4'-phosphopantetheinyl transferase superfamily protein [Streptomyces humicola]